MAKTDASVTLGLDMIAFQAGLNSAQKAMEATMGKIKRIAEIALAGIGVAFSAKMFADGIAGAIATGKEVDKLAREFQMAPKDIILMNHALDRSEQTMASTSAIMGEFREKMILVKAGVGTTRSTFENLLGSMEELEGLSLNEQFAKLAVKVNAIRDPLQRAAISAAVFGASGAKAVAQFQSGDLAKAQELFGKQAKAMEKSASQLALASDSFKRIQSAGESFFNIITAKLAPTIELVAEKLENILPMVEDFAEKFGDKLKRGVDIIIGLFKKGEIGEALKLSFQVAIGELANRMAQAAIFAGKIMQKAVMGGFEFVTKGGFLNALMITVQSFGSFLLGELLTAFKTPIKWFQDALEFAIQAVMESFSRMKEFFGIAGGNKFRAQDLETIQKKNAGKLEVGTASGIQSADSLILKLKDAGKAWDNVDTSALTGVLKGIPGMWAESATQAFTNDEAKAALGKLFADAATVGKEVTDKAKKGALRPGGGAAGAPEFSTINTRFDELRRIGGGAGAAAMDVPKRQLSVLEQIRDTLKSKDGKLSPASQLTGGARFSFSLA